NAAVDGLDVVVLSVRKQDAEGAEQSRDWRDEDTADLEQLGKAGSMHRTVAAVGDQDEVARVSTSPGRDRLDGANHPRIGDGVNGEAGFVTPKPKRLRDLFIDHSGRLHRVDPHRATGNCVGTDVAEDDVRVRDRGEFAPPAITGRARPGARALGADVK